MLCLIGFLSISIRSCIFEIFSEHSILWIIYLNLKLSFHLNLFCYNWYVLVGWNYICSSIPVELIFTFWCYLFYAIIVFLVLMNALLIILKSFPKSGKTLLAKTLARFVSVPFVIADATTLTQVCWVLFVY